MNVNGESHAGSNLYVYLWAGGQATIQPFWLRPWCVRAVVKGFGVVPY